MLVQYALDGRVATVTMDDGKVNVMSIAMQTELSAALDRANDDGAVVVIEGRDGVFSAGFDLATLRGGGDDGWRMVRGAPGTRTGAPLASTRVAASSTTSKVPGRSTTSSATPRRTWPCSPPSWRVGPRSSVQAS